MHQVLLSVRAAGNALQPHNLTWLPAPAGPAAYKPEVAIQAKTIREFDDAITRVAFGWPSGEVAWWWCGAMQPHGRIACR